MRIGSTRRRAALGVAAGGVLLGHWLTYVLVDPNAHQRATELAGTGHAYLGLANDLGLVAALIALSAIFLGGLTRHEETAPSMGAFASRLVAFQVLAFTGMELLERISAGAPLSGVLHHGILPVGIAIQASVAVIGALAMRWLLRAARLVESALGTAPSLLHRAPTAALVLPTFRPPARRAVTAAVIRGPPAPASPR
jgi:hypothetical protein